MSDEPNSESTNVHIAIRSSDATARIQAVNALTTQEAVIRVIRESPHADARRSATRKLEDPATLDDLAMHDKDMGESVEYSWDAGQGTEWQFVEGVQMIALQRTRNQPLLAQMALNASHVMLQIQALSRITNPQLLAHVAFARDNLTYIKAWPTRLHDDGALAEAAVTWFHQGLCARQDDLRRCYPNNWATLVEHIKDPAALQKVVGGCDVSSMPAFEEWTDAGLLNRDCYATIRPIVMRALALGIQRISDPAILANIARTSTCLEHRCLAIETLSDMELVGEFAGEDYDPPMRQTAISRLTNMALLKRLAEADRDERVRKYAVIRLAVLFDTAAEASVLEAMHGMPGALLWDIARHMERFERRDFLFLNARNRALLQQIALAGEQTPDLRMHVVPLIEDQAILDQMAAECRNARIEYVLVRHLADQRSLFAIARRSEDWLVRYDATGKLTGKAALEEILAQDEHEDVRRIAKGRLRTLFPPEDPPGTKKEQCPRGHGPLSEWGGKARCWTCGYPEK